ncbi:hypothetical protein Tco_1179566, partial [Tanacetum coccineum]
GKGPTLFLAVITLHGSLGRVRYGRPKGIASPAQIRIVAHRQVLDGAVIGKSNGDGECVVTLLLQRATVAT